MILNITRVGEVCTIEPLCDYGDHLYLGEWDFHIIYFAFICQDIYCIYSVSHYIVYDIKTTFHYIFVLVILFYGSNQFFIIEAGYRSEPSINHMLQNPLSN